jgi:hypothetical protein
MTAVCNFLDAYWSTVNHLATLNFPWVLKSKQQQVIASAMGYKRMKAESIFRNVRISNYTHINHRERF